MLIKFLSQGAGDFRGMVRRRTMVGGGMLFLGGLALVLYGTLVQGSTLPDFAQGVYLGVGAALVGCGVGYLAYNGWLWFHPEKAKKEFIKESDEREKLIVEKGTVWAFWSVLGALFPALMVAAPLNMSVFWTLYCVLMGMALTMLIYWTLARRKL